MFFANGLPFELARSKYFKEAMEAVASFGAGYKPPGSEMIRTSLLKKEKTSVAGKVEKLREHYPIYGATVCSDGWSDTRNRCATACCTACCCVAQV